MAHYVPIDGFDNFTGAMSKKKKKGVNHMTITRRKRIIDPLTGKVIGYGPKEIYVQNRRDYDTHPLTPKEQAQNSRWEIACREAPRICKDPSDPRFMELYNRWLAQLKPNDKNQSFIIFVRSVLASEKGPE